MKLTHEYDSRTMTQRFVLEVKNQEMRRLLLDGFDRAVLQTPAKGVADALRSIELIARRLEEQE